MCRWMAYMGDPVRADELLIRPVHSIIDQSLHAKLGGFTTNGDGFGVGWYGDGPVPAVYKSVHPAWNDENLREIAETLESGAFIAHVRAAIGSPVQQSNCHPFRHGGTLFVHNGFVRDFHRIKRDVVLRIDELLGFGVTGLGLRDAAEQTLSVGRRAKEVGRLHE